MEEVCGALTLQGATRCELTMWALYPVLCYTAGNQERKVQTIPFPVKEKRHTSKNAAGAERGLRLLPCQYTSGARRPGVQGDRKALQCRSSTGLTAPVTTVLP